MKEKLSVFGFRKICIGSKKTELFLQVVDDVLEDKVSILLAEKLEEGGLTADLKKVIDAVLIFTKQRRERAGNRLVSRTETQTATPSIIPAIPLLTGGKIDPVLDELIKGMSDLRVKLVELERTQMK